MSERNWRTRWGARLRLLCICTCAGLAMLLAARAHADWKFLSMQGKAVDSLDAWSPGTFSVSFSDDPHSTEGAYLFVDGGLVRQKAEPGLAVAGTYYWQPHDCFVLLRRDSPGSLSSSGPDEKACVSSSSLPISTNAQQVKHARGGGGALVLTDSNELYLSDAGIYSTNFSQLNFPGTFNPAVAPGVVRVGSRVDALVASGFNNSTVYWLIGGQSIEMTPTLSAGHVQAIDVFSVRDSPSPYAVVGTDEGFMQGSIPASTAPLRRVQSLDGGMGVNSVSMNVESGGAEGYGFGMAVVARPDGRGSQLMSAVPTLSDSKAGTEWRLRDAPTLAPGVDWQQVSCVEARYCVFTTTGTDSNNLVVYTNGAAPTFSVKAEGPASVDGGVVDGSVWLEEEHDVTLTLMPKDLDGDPVLAQCSGRSEDGGLRTLSVDAGADGGFVVALRTHPVCRTGPVGVLNVQASDGLGAHDLDGKLTLNAVHTRRPEPIVRLGDGMTVPPAGPPPSLRAGASSLLELQVDPVEAGGCALDGVSWEDAGTSSPLAPTLTQAGNTARLTPPALFCGPSPLDFTYPLTVTDEGGLSTQRPVTVRLEPNPTPIAEGTLQMDAGGEEKPQRVFLSSTLDCPEERGLKARLQFKQIHQTGDAGRVDPVELVSLPHTWMLPRDLDCGDYELTGRLQQAEDGGFSPESRVDFPGTEARLELPAQELVAHCGQGARTTLAASFPGQSCQNPRLTWVQQEGPPLAQPLLEGNFQPLATEDLGLDSLVGQSVVLQVTADSNSGPPASQPYSLRITVEPFVKVHHRTELPAASETEFIGIFTELENTTSCGVTQVHYAEQLKGFSYVENSAHFNGQKVSDSDVAWDGTTLSVDHLELAGNATGTLTYLARPHLVGTRHLQGVASLRDISISQPDALEPPASDSGCGCSSPGSSAPLLLLALGTVMAAVRRRRHP